MLVYYFIRPGCGAWLLPGLLCTAMLAQDPPTQNKDTGSFDRLAEIFGRPGTSGIQGKAWVIVDRGPANAPVELRGWLIEDGTKEITLLDWHGNLHKLRKPAGDEKRPELKVMKDGSTPLNAFFQADRSVAWKVMEADYSAWCKKFLTDGLPGDKANPGLFSDIKERFGLADHIVDSARYAHFANQLGQKELAAALHAHALGGYAKYARRYILGSQEQRAFHGFVAERIASRWRNDAIFSGHRGTPRKELRDQWERIAAIPHHQYRAEATAMARLYQNLIDEDARWEEPDAKDLAKMTTEQRVGYWLHHLRDLDIGQFSDPGRCYVLVDFDFANEKRGLPNAAIELKKLGLAAVPQLIAHLDDSRPTRCKGHWRSYWPEMHYLLSYGDCCLQILESITGESIFRDAQLPRTPIPDGEGRLRKEKAEKWWQESLKQKPGSEKP